MSGKGVSRTHAALGARLEAYRAARDEGLDTYRAAERAGVGERTGFAYERWYRRVSGQPEREKEAPWTRTHNAGDREWRLPS